MSIHEGPIIPAVASGVATYLGQQQANVATRDLTREQMAFQERMSSTAYQRAMHDMRQAGLNPMLAFQQGGASSPGGASATMQSALGPAVATAQQARRLTADLKQVRADTSLTEDKEWSQVQERAESRSRQDLYDRQSDLSMLQRRILSLQVPALENSARVEQSKVGATAAFMGRIRESLFGGRGFFNPVGGR